MGRKRRDAPRPDGVVENRDGRLVLIVQSLDVRQNFSRVIKLLISEGVDVIEMTRHGKVCMHMVRPPPLPSPPPPPTPSRLAVGEFNFK